MPLPLTRPWPALLLGLLAVLPLGTQAAPRSTLQAYASEGELRHALAQWQQRAQALQQDQRRRATGLSPKAANDSAGNLATVSMATMAESAAPAAPAAADSITNVQTAGVDEGGIVKRAGDHLVILRRGRLFTVRVGGDQLVPVAAVDAFGPGINPQGTWYDELLISGSTVAVVGYSASRGGTEIGLFNLQRDGQLQYRATWQLRSFDYYASRNYASRLVGNKLIFYTPSRLSPWGELTPANLPGLRRWRGQAATPDFERILPATRIYRVDDDFDPAESLALHTVTMCDLAAREMSCESSAVLGPEGRVFYVSGGSVYVWTSSAPRERWGGWQRPRVAGDRPRARSAVYRLPLDGSTPSALKTSGVPVDQMSFLEDDSGHLNVLLRENGPGEGMWGAERNQGSMALLRVPLTALGDGQQAAERQHYRPLPEGPHGEVQNRYVGDWLLWGSNPGTQAWALHYADADASPVRLAPGHAVERIEALGSHALLAGNQGNDLHLSAVRLGPRQAQLAGHHVQTGARQGETRSHGFFYRATGSDEGLLGLPVLQDIVPDGRGGAQAGRGGASVMFLRQRQGAFSALGALHARADAPLDDHCQASCVDWYGNARPLFIGERVFALMGYELVEGQLGRGLWRERLNERRRIDFAVGVSQGWEAR